MKNLGQMPTFHARCKGQKWIFSKIKNIYQKGSGHSADVLKVPNFFPQTPDWQVFHPQSGDFVQLLAKKLDLFVI